MGRRDTIRLAAASGGITLADLMRARVVTMREAWQHLAEVEASGGPRGLALLSQPALNPQES